DNQDVLCEAINSDFGCRDPLVTQMSDLLTSISALKNVKKNLKHWMKTKRRKSPFPMNIIGGRSSVHYQPKGVVGIMSPWNVPVNVIFSPLADVLGAGNRAMIKPSEFTPATSNLVAKLISQYFDSSEISVVKGDGAVGAEFSALPFDHLMFTGSSAIGKLVMAEAAKNLTPVTLELGGKSPVIVSDSADLADCIEKLVAGKTLNAGQVCITADYCYIPDALLDDFVSGIKDVYSTYFSRCLDNDDYVSIINKRHFDRLSDYLRDAENRGGHVINLGNPKEDWLNSDKLKIPLHLVVNPTDNMLVMQEELFGPILCIKTYNDLNTCITEINHRPRPLALYYFGKDKAEQQHVIDNSISGNVTINDIAVHFACDDIPFGGIGESGMGQLHGREGFKTFSHAKGVFKQGFIHLAKAAGTLPPFSDKARKMIAGVIKK
ncbi:MAG: coniferyl aldehyde dehydrogenase, partial [Porticoccaceae bacterium]|nr:coniferyl aldehyde dehydrogenase [Porticoccaceae bacterium]